MQHKIKHIKRQNGGNCDFNHGMVLVPDGLVLVFLETANHFTFSYTVDFVYKQWSKKQERKRSEKKDQIDLS